MTETNGFSPLDEYRRVRAQSEILCAPLEIEDYVIQAAPFASPTKWHLSHVSWFFETFLLDVFVPDYEVFDPIFGHLFNSYYQGVGEPFPRARRGALSRPTVAHVHAYRQHVDAAMERLLVNPPAEQLVEITARLRLGIHHEQQHQELILMDLKYNLAQNPTFPAYRAELPNPCKLARDLGLIGFEGGVVEIGYDGSGFHFDNERPRHRVYLEAYGLGDRLVTNGEYLEFIEAGGYRDHRHWLSDGWDLCRRDRLEAPLYWVRRQESWFEYTLAGLVPLDPNAPVCHVSYYEADAFARWAGHRLPTEFEWEHAAREMSVTGNFVEAGRLHPAGPQEGSFQLFGDLWEWTSSDYGPYPGYAPAEGAIGEYNGKFMCSQRVLRGGSCATPADHCRASYRNFFYPEQRWPFTGIRIARS